VLDARLPWDRIADPRLAEQNQPRWSTASLVEKRLNEASSA
jgi:hypothetical protein